MSPRAAYAAFMLLSLAVFLAARRFLPAPPETAAALAALPAWKRAVLGLAAFAGGALGAKLPFVADSGWLADGKTLVAGLAGGYAAVEAAKLAIGARLKTGDALAVPLALAIGVGRWGCWFNRCCYGTPTTLPWGVDFGDGLPRHPTQAYESLFHLALAGALFALGRSETWRPVLRWQMLKLYLIAYCAYRFLTELIRPEPIWAAGLTGYQAASLVLAAALVVQWIVDDRRKARAGINPAPTSAPAT